MPVTANQSFAASGVLQTNSGWTAPNAHWQIPETVTDPCNPPSPESVDLRAGHRHIPHTEQIDKGDEAYLFDGTQDTTVDGADVHQTITGRLALDNLANTLP